MSAKVTSQCAEKGVSLQLHGCGHYLNFIVILMIKLVGVFWSNIYFQIFFSKTSTADCKCLFSLIQS